MEFINFIINNILTQAPITIGVIALIGLVLQKKSVGQTISGTFKTILGFMVLSAGSAVIVQALTYFGAIFTEGYGMQGLVPSIEAINGQAMNDLGLGSEIALTLGAIFICNVLIARFTKWKYIFLTGQALLWMATICAVFGFYCGLRGPVLILVGGIVGGIFAVAMPAIAQPYVRKITGNDDIALGHFCTIGYVLTAWVSKLFGGKSRSTEELVLPKGLEFLQDTYLSIGVVMVPFFLVTAFFAGPEFCATFAGNTNYLVHAFMQAIQFVVGVYVLLSGVRLLLAELVPAFRGIAMKIVPDAIPALDCPVLFPYAPNAVIVGFVSTTIGSVIGMFLFPMFGLPMILPGMMTNFFAGGCAGIFGNAAGGTRGAIISGIVHGLFISLLPALLAPMLGDIGFINATCTDVDTIVCGMFYGWLLKPLMLLF
ncbi:MAG: PTS sugar transporter subunit IIC [Erysipelotrichaceae bacterium]